MENIRIARSEQRDLLQDLQDVAEGIEVVHAVDLTKAAIEKKKAARAHRRDLKEKKLQKVLRSSAKREEMEQITLFLS